MADAVDAVPVHSVRLHERARRDIDLAWVHFADTASEVIADVWRDGLYQVLASLAVLPRRCPLAPERFRREVRYLLYRRSEGAAAYRILFVILGEEADALDVPTVLVIHIRHASARPLRRAELRDIEKLNN